MSNAANDGSERKRLRLNPLAVFENLQHVNTGLAGFGDLVLTCTGALSRNHTLGKKIGEGMKLNEILSEMRMVAEGVKTAKSVYDLSREIGVDMPISQEIYRILYEGLSPKEAVYRLMTRDLKKELDET